METRLKELREEKKITQLNLAIKTSTTQQTISKIENGTCIPKVDLAVRIAKLFNVSLDYLFMLTNTKRSVETQIFYNRKLEKHVDLIIDLEKLNDENRETIKILIKRFLDTQKNENKE